MGDRKCGITTTVNGTCYSVPPFSAGHIPGICDALRAAISGLNCSSGGLADSLLLPALRAILKSSSGYDIGDVKLADALNAIQTSLANGKTFSIDCASFTASATLGSAPTANVSLSTNLNVFGSQLTPQMTWTKLRNQRSWLAMAAIMTAIAAPAYQR